LLFKRKIIKKGKEKEIKIKNYIGFANYPVGLF
jgi:hypothetical protein